MSHKEKFALIRQMIADAWEYLDLRNNHGEALAITVAIDTVCAFRENDNE